MKTRPKLTSIAVIAALLVGIAYSGWKWLAGQKPEPPSHVRNVSRSASSAAVMTVSYSQTPRVLDATGTVRAELEAAISTKVIGRVVRVTVREGDRVQRGQALVLLDSRDLDAAVAQADASVRAARVGRETAVVSERMERSLSAARITESRAQVAQSAAAVQAAQAKLDLLESGPRKQERAQASIAVAQAKSNLSLAQANLRRMESLMNEGAISRQQFDTYRTAADVAKAQFDTVVEAQSMTDEGSRAEEIRAGREQLRQAKAAQTQAEAAVAHAEAAANQVEVRRQEIYGAEAQIGQTRAALQAAEVTRGFATITAPFDGVVVAKLADPGAMATPGTPLLKIQGGAIRLEAVVPESGLASISRGRPIQVQLDAISSHTIHGTVSEIAPQGDPTSHTFLVKVSLPSNSGAMAGMFGRARFPISFDRRLLISAHSVVERDGLHYVFVVSSDGLARLRLVTVGDPEGGKVAVLSGLQPGERVAVSNTERLTDGGRVAGATTRTTELAAGR